MRRRLGRAGTATGNYAFYWRGRGKPISLLCVICCYAPARSASQIDCVHTREETRSQLKKSKYDLLLVDYPEGDGGARHWLGDPDDGEVRIPSVFLGEYFNHGGMEAAIQSAACHGPGVRPDGAVPGDFMF